MSAQPHPPLRNGMKVSVITSNLPAVLTKTFSLVNGVLNKKTSANLVRGDCELKELGSIAEFSEIIKSLSVNQALCFGVAKRGKIRVLSKMEYEKQKCPDDAITRSNKNFDWSNASGIMMLDYDPVEGRSVLSMDELRKVIFEVIPELKYHDHCTMHSSGSLIFSSVTGEQLIGEKGKRIYIHVKDASDIPRAGKTLVNRLWLKGYGFIQVGKAGQLLERCPVDSAVWQPNRLDFASGASCEEGLKQARGEPKVYNFGSALNSDLYLPDLTYEEQARYKKLISDEKERHKPYSDLRKQEYIDSRLKEISLNGTDKVDVVNAKLCIQRMLDIGLLSGSILIHLENGMVVSVNEILGNPKKYHGLQTKDPIEPDYNGGKICGILYLDKKDKVLHSQAHGGKTFRLKIEPKKIEYKAGSLSKVVEDTFLHLKKLGDIYEVAGKMVRVFSGKIDVFKQYSLMNYLGDTIQYYRNKVDKNGLVTEQLIDPPTYLIKQMLEINHLQGLRCLSAVITTAVIRKDGSLLNKSGYDEETQLYLDIDSRDFTISDSPSIDDVKKAIATLMYPFEKFPFSTPLDKSVCMAALFSAVLRPVLPKCPAFGFDAPLQGSGKTLLAQSVAALLTGETQSVHPYSNINVKGAEDEIKKFILSILIKGDLSVIWDNLLGTFSSAVVASMLTSRKITGRLLGTNDTAIGENKCLFFFTGNNLCFAGDMPRRVLIVRIDPKIADPTNRTFEFDPLEYVLKNRNAMVCAVLTICRGWFSSSEYKLGMRAKGRMPSFEIWDDLIRQPTAWIAREIIPTEYCDVIESIKNSQRNDPEMEQLHGLLLALYNQFQNNKFRAKDVIQFTRPPFDIYEALEGIIHNKITAISVGRFFKYKIDRIVEGLSLQLIEDKRNGNLFWIKNENQNNDSSSNSPNGTVVSISPQTKVPSGFKSYPPISKPPIPSPPSKL